MTDSPPGRRLDTWKEVAAYLKRDVSTVRRWEAREGLPVHRLTHASRDSILAYTHELDAWQQSRRRVRRPDPSPAPAPQPAARGLQSPAAIAAAIGLAVAVIASAGLVLFPGQGREPLDGISRSRSAAREVANRFYLRGRDRMESRDRAGFTLAIADFREAVARDPEFARAYAGLADAYSLLAFYRMRPAQEAFEEARVAVLMALKLDDGLAEAHTSLAGLLAYHDWNWVESEREYRQAIALDPSFAPARHWYSNCLSLLGRHDEAIQQARRAVDLKPLSLITLTGALGNAYVQANQDDAAERQYQSALEFDPRFGNAHAGLASLYWGRGQLLEARREMAMAASLHDNPNWAAKVAALDAALGNPDEARRQLSRLEQQADRITPLSLATIYAQLGDHEQALDLLERAMNEGDPELPAAKIEPGLAPLRTDARFEAILRRMNLM